MEVISSTGRTRSGLNPDAAPYVPAALRAVEDFSPAWWALVESSPWFADYWMRERFQDWSEDDVADPFDVDDELDLPDDITDALISFPHPVEKVEGGRREVMAWGADKWKAALLGCGAEGARCQAPVQPVRPKPRSNQGTAAQPTIFPSNARVELAREGIVVKQRSVRSGVYSRIFVAELGRELAETRGRSRRIERRALDALTAWDAVGAQGEEAATEGVKRGAPGGSMQLFTGERSEERSSTIWARVREFREICSRRQGSATREGSRVTGG